MPMRTGRALIAFNSGVYAIGGLCLLQINPVNPWVAAARACFLLLFSSVVVYGLVLVVHASFSRRVACTATFSPLTNKIIQNISLFACAFMIAYCLLPAFLLHSDHHVHGKWSQFVNRQATFISWVEGNAAASRFWNGCAEHLADVAAFYERKHEFEKALDFYSEYNNLGNGAAYAAVYCEGVFGRVCDEMKDFEKADTHYDRFASGVDENSRTDSLVCEGRLMRMFQFAPEEILIAEFPWAEHLATRKNESAFQIGQCYTTIEFSKLDDYQRELLRPVFHPEMLKSSKTSIVRDCQ